MNIEKLLGRSWLFIFLHLSLSSLISNSQDALDLFVLALPKLSDPAKWYSDNLGNWAHSFSVLLRLNLHPEVHSAAVTASQY